MKKLLTIIAAITVVASFAEAREIKRMVGSSRPLKLHRPNQPTKPEPTATAVQAYRIVLQRRVDEAKALLEKAEADLLAFEIKAAEQAGR